MPICPIEKCRFKSASVLMLKAVYHLYDVTDSLKCTFINVRGSLPLISMLWSILPFIPNLESILEDTKRLL